MSARMLTQTPNMLIPVGQIKIKECSVMRRILACITFLYKVKFKIGVSAGIKWAADLYTYVRIRQLVCISSKTRIVL